MFETDLKISLHLKNTNLIAEGWADEMISVSLRSNAFKSSQATCSSDILTVGAQIKIQSLLSHSFWSFYWQAFWFRDLKVLFSQSLTFLSFVFMLVHVYLEPVLFFKKKIFW